jgi:predicted PurR-regulated permease PerM
MKAVSVGRINSLLFLGFLICTALYFARSFLVPFSLAIILSMLMLPVCQKLEEWHLPRGLAIVLCILLILLFIAGMFGLVAGQFAGLQEDLPKIQTEVQSQLDKFQQWVQQQLKIPPQEQETMLKESLSSAKGGGAGAIAKSILSGTIGGLTTLVLILAYFFFFLYYREKYEVFFLKIRGENHTPEVKEVMHKIQKVAVKYIGGRFLGILILATLNSVGLLIVGAKNAILLGILTALFTFVPYVGTLVGGAFAAGTVLITQSASSALTLIGILALIQMLDEYLIEPYIVGGNVALSPLAVIVALVIGGLLWGIPGMILFIPFLGIAKIIFDHVPSLHPYSYLVGINEESSGSSPMKKIKGWFGKK